jgi:hypothetical protein
MQTVSQKILIFKNNRLLIWIIIGRLYGILTGKYYVEYS